MIDIGAFIYGTMSYGAYHFEAPHGGPMTPQEAVMQAVMFAAFTLWAAVRLWEAGCPGRIVASWRAQGYGVTAFMHAFMIAVTLLSGKPPGSGSGLPRGGAGEPRAAEEAAAEEEGASGGRAAFLATHRALGNALSGGGVPRRSPLPPPLGDPDNWWALEGRDTTDTDGDGMPDEWEKMFGLDPNNPADALESWDRSGMTNLEKFLYRCHPLRRDTDGDGMPDVYEMAHYPLLCPWLPDDTEDPDGDLLDNYHEYALGCDPGDPDTNGSGMGDGRQAAAGLDPTLSPPDWAMFGKTDITVRVDGLQAARRAGVVIGHVLHSGVKARTYTLAAGARYPLAIVDLDPGNTNACSGTVRLTLDAGTFVHGFTNEFAVAFPLNPSAPPCPEDAEVTVAGIYLDVPCTTWTGPNNSQTLYVTASFVPDGETIPGTPVWTVQNGTVNHIYSDGMSATVTLNFPDTRGGEPLSRGGQCPHCDIIPPCIPEYCPCECHAEDGAPRVDVQKGPRKTGVRVNPPKKTDPEEEEEEEDPWHGERYITHDEAHGAVTLTYGLAYSTNAVKYSWHGAPGDKVTWKIDGPARFLVDDEEKMTATGGHVSALPKDTVGGSSTVSVTVETKKKGIVNKSTTLQTIKLVASPIVTFAYGDDVMTNPGGMFVGNKAEFIVNVSANVNKNDIWWNTATGAATITGHERMGLSEMVYLKGNAEGDDTVMMTLDKLYGAKPPEFNVRIYSASDPVPVTFVFLCDTNGAHAGSSDQIPVLIGGLNGVYRQAGMSFTCAGIQYHTNANWYANSADPAVQLQIVNILKNTGGLEVYVVPSLGQDVLGAEYEGMGILVTGGVSVRILAHEIGHECGLNDIFDHHALTTLTVTGKVSEERLPRDWNNGPGPEEYYTRGLEQAELMKQTLMYGYSPQTGGGIDIPAGTVFGLKVLRYDILPPEIGLEPVKVGLQHINRTPAHNQ